MTVFIECQVVILLVILPLPSQSVRKDCQAKWKTFETSEASLTITEDENNNLLFRLDNDFTTGVDRLRKLNKMSRIYCFSFDWEIWF